MSVARLEAQLADTDDTAVFNVRFVQTTRVCDDAECRWCMQDYHKYDVPFSSHFNFHPAYLLPRGHRHNDAWKESGSRKQTLVDVWIRNVRSHCTLRTKCCEVTVQTWFPSHPGYRSWGAYCILWGNSICFKKKQINLFVLCYVDTSSKS